LARKGVPLLDVTLGQILVPDASAVSRFIALFEQEDELKNLVFCQTVIDALDRRNRTRTMRNVRKIAADPARSSVVFANEVFAQTRVHGKSADVDRDTRAVVRAAEWYRQHLEAQNKAQRVVILTQREVYSAEHGVEVWRLEDYLAEQHPKLVEHFRAIEQATQDGDMDVTAISAGEFAQARLQAKAQGSYAKHYSEGDISDGLRNGTLVRGTIRLRAGGGMRSESQGVIERSDAPDIVVVGRAALNRACSGDTVVVRLLGNSESSVGEAKAADGDDDDADDAADSEDALAVEQIEAGDEAPVVADKANLATA
ncbi:hypothetical protein IW137_005629, partial [Coemansia sp. RSA 1287]